MMSLLQLRRAALRNNSKNKILCHTPIRAIPPQSLTTSYQQHRRSMSMFLWRHVPIYQKEGTKKGGWRLHPIQKKPATPVRVDGVRPAAGKVLWKHCVIHPDGVAQPYDGKYGEDFMNFWREVKEKWRQMMDYQEARGIPTIRMCPRCDEPMNWLHRAPAKWNYMPIEGSKRSIFAKTVPTSLMAHGNDVEAAGKDPNYDGPMEDRYCCPNDACGIREARVEYRHNVAEVEVLNGLTRKQWRPAKFGGGRLKSERAKARLAEEPFENRGICMKVEFKRHMQVEDTKPLMPYMNSVTHEEAFATVAHRAKARHGDELSKSFGRLKGSVPKWYRGANSFVFSPAAHPKTEPSFETTPCDECSSESDRYPSVCLSCGFILCKTCRTKCYPSQKNGQYKMFGSCPGCNKHTASTLDLRRQKNVNKFKKFIEAKENLDDPRRAQWLLVLGDAYVLSRPVFSKDKAKEYYEKASKLGLPEGQHRLDAFEISTAHQVKEANLWRKPKRGKDVAWSSQDDEDRPRMYEAVAVQKSRVPKSRFHSVPLDELRNKMGALYSQRFSVAQSLPRTTAGTAGIGQSTARVQKDSISRVASRL